MRDYQLAVVIGRFQPLHNEHLKLINRALEIADRVLILVGSHRAAPTVKNPFTTGERASMIEPCIPDNRRYDVMIAGIRDYHYSDVLWCAEVQQQAMRMSSAGRPVALVGTYKDSSSYYLQYFPQWTFEPVKMDALLDASTIRQQWWERSKRLASYNAYHPHVAKESMEQNEWRSWVPKPVEAWLDEHYFPTKKYHHHVNEWEFYDDYKDKWGKGPFITVDSIVTCSGHVLVVKRKDLPGQGLYALPGGFLNGAERIADGAIRELREETGLLHRDLKKVLVTSRVFDYPGRSLRGRIITHAYHFALELPELPTVQAGSDAETCCWLPICDVYLNEDKFFEDHFHIINHFVTKG